LKDLEAIINKEEAAIMQAKVSLDKQKQNLSEKKTALAAQQKQLAEGGTVKKKTVVVKQLKDGIKTVVGKDGVVRYFDKYGKEITEADAFKEVIMEVPDDGDAGAEYEEYIDPKTGKKMVRKKEPTVR